MVQSGPSNSIVEESYDQNQFSGVLGLNQQIPLKVGWPKPTSVPQAPRGHILG